MEDAKKKGIGDYIRQFIMGFQLFSSVALGIFIVAVLLLALKYFDIPSPYGQEEIKLAQKIGNWEFPDGDYVLKNFENIQLESKNVSIVEIKDKKSGNIFRIFEVNFFQEEFLRLKDNIQNKLLEKYKLEKFYLKSSGNKTGRYGKEVSYNIVGWNSAAGVETGIIGSLDCVKNQKTGDSIIVFVANSSAKYDEERALSFINTLKCPAGGGTGNGGVDVSDKLDTDKDGLPDVIEKMLLANPYNSDTDGDGYNDFDEIKNGFSPMAVRPWDKYTLEEFGKVKKDIEYISPDTYDKLFGGK